MRESARLTPRTAWRPEGADFLLYDIETDAISRGNPEGRLVLEGCRAGHLLARIAGDLALRYDIEASRALADVHHFVEMLVAGGLAEWVDGPA